MEPITDSVTPDWITDAWDYAIDAYQRTVLFADVMRKRGNLYLEHLKQGQPPVLVFDYKTIIDGRDLERPVNYSLVQIIDRRGTRPDRRTASHPPAASDPERRSLAQDRRQPPEWVEKIDSSRQRPIVIIDPRAGHGPGIGGSKQDSQIGMALDAGHPVYFLVFSTHPVAGQTLTDVWKAEIRFIEEVRRRHPQAPKPAVIGNCQGGWAAALIGAQRPDIVGPMAFNGSPLSYWGGVQGVHPMRYFGGLLGGMWVNTLLSDLGNGLFDGANLVANFENLNPANTWWSKSYNLYANVDTEEQRFLNFEKWWGGFFLMSAQEIETIVNGLFIGNQLEQGQFELEPGKKIELGHFKNPIVMFASFGDNITPPQQAFNWVAKVYGTTDEIKRRGQVIVLILHERIGHLGIFVSAKIARKQHREIIGSFDMLEYLPPGLYEMVFEETPKYEGSHEHAVRFVELNVEDILAMDDGLEDEHAFYPVKAVSDVNNRLYKTFVRPWLKWFITENSAAFMRQFHPLRLQRYWISDMNPFMLPLKPLASSVRETRRPVPADNMFVAMQKAISDNIASSLNLYRDLRDASQEMCFKMLYDNPLMKAIFPAAEFDPQKIDSHTGNALYREDDFWQTAMLEGGVPEATIRILLAVMTADRELTRGDYDIAEKILKKRDWFNAMHPARVRELVRDQSRILQTDSVKALKSLSNLLPTARQRKAALAIVDERTQLAGRPLNRKEKAVFNKIQKILTSTK